MWLQTLCSIEAGAVSHAYKGGRCLAVALPRRSSRASNVPGYEQDAPRCTEMPSSASKMRRARRAGKTSTMSISLRDIAAYIPH